MQTTTLDPVITGSTPVETAPVPTIEELMAATKPMTLSDLIRNGSSTTTKAQGWGQGSSACALSAAGLAWERLEELRAR